MTRTSQERVAYRLGYYEGWLNAIDELFDILKDYGPKLPLQKAAEAAYDHCAEADYLDELKRWIQGDTSQDISPPPLPPFIYKNGED